MAEHKAQAVEFRGDSLQRLRDFPDTAKQRMGYQIGRLQVGELPDDYKPMKSVGPGVYEIRVKENSNEYRSFYIAKRRDGIFILHCFQKKTAKTAAKDLELGRQRFKELPPEPLV